MEPGWEEFRRAPLSALITDFAASGFAVEALVEPTPALSMATMYPTVSEKLSTEAGNDRVLADQASAPVRDRYSFVTFEQAI